MGKKRGKAGMNRKKNGGSTKGFLNYAGLIHTEWV